MPHIVREPALRAGFSCDAPGHVLIRVGDLAAGRRSRTCIRESALEEGFLEPRSGMLAELFLAVRRMEDGLPEDCRVVLTYDVPVPKPPNFGPHPVPSCALSSLKEMRCFKRESGAWRIVDTPDFGVDLSPELFCLFLAVRKPVRSLAPPELALAAA